MKKCNRSITLIVSIIVGMVVVFASTPHAFAHGNFEFLPGGNVNNTIRVVIGQTHEPSFTDEEHNLEMTITHKMTSIPVANLGKSQAASTSNILFVQTWFYPDSTLVGTDKHVPALTGCTNPVANSPANCGPGAGYTDSEPAGAIAAISTAFPDSGAPGQYRQPTRQFYTEQGRTLYHVFGEMNVFNDTSVGTIPINLWTDGSVLASGISRVSVCEGSSANKAACKNGDATYNKTKSWGSSFSMENKTSIYWPGASAGVTENTHPTNLRKAIGTIRDNSWDTWNVLEQLTNALRGVTGFVQTSIPDHTPRNYTNPGPTSSGQYSFP